jgi:hypothetical protein
MKKPAYIIVILMLVMSVVSVSTANAQTNSAQQVTADIPFTFHVGNKNLPAGQYTVRCINPSSDVKVLQLRSTDGKSTVLLQTSSIVGRMNKDAKLVFNRYGNQYYFAQAWLVGENVGMQAVKSRNEKATAKEMARLAYEPEMIALTNKR